MKIKFSQIFIPITLVFTFLISGSCKREPIELGVRIGDNVFTKEVFFSDPDIGEVTAIQYTDSVSQSFEGILIVGEKGSSLVNLEGEVIEKTIFEDKGGLVIPFFNPESQSFDYLNKGGGWQPVSYIDNSGKTVLSISEPTPNDVVLIDVNNDDRNDLVMGSNAGGGLVAFNLMGEKIWKKNTSNSFDVDIFEEEEMKIVHTDGDKILVRSKSGELERTLTLPFSSFEKGFWPGKEKDAIIGMDQDTLIAYNLIGEKLGSYSLERRGTASTTEALHNSTGKEYFGAIVSLLASTHRSEFYVFDSEDSLIFHEAIEAVYPVLESFSTDDEGKLILVGGDYGIVWSYNFKNSLE